MIWYFVIFGQFTLQFTQISQNNIPLGKKVIEISPDRVSCRHENISEHLLLIVDIGWDQLTPRSEDISVFIEDKVIVEYCIRADENQAISR